MEEGGAGDGRSEGGGGGGQGDNNSGWSSISIASQVPFHMVKLQ